MHWLPGKVGFSLAQSSCSLVIVVIVGPVCTEYQVWSNVQFCTAAERGDLDSVFLAIRLHPGFSTLVVCRVSFPRQLAAVTTANAHIKTSWSIYAVIWPYWPKFIVKLNLYLTFTNTKFKLESLCWVYDGNLGIMALQILSPKVFFYPQEL